MGASVSAVLPGAATDTDPLHLYFPDDARRDSVALRYGTTNITWSARAFGDGATFTLLRTSARHATPAPPDKSRSARLDWWPSTWTLTVTRASFPAGLPFEMNFTFSRAAPDKDKAIGDWKVGLTTKGWATRAAPPQFRQRKLTEVLAPGGAIEADLSRTEAQATLNAWFGQRIEAAGPATLELDATLRWHVRSAAGLYILNLGTRSGSPFCFRALTVDRVFGNPVMPAGGQGPAPESNRLFAEYAPRSASVLSSTGLYGALSEPLPPPAAPVRLQVGAIPDLRAELTLLDLSQLQAGLRHWGRPEDTVAGAIRTSEEGDATCRAKLVLRDGGPARQHSCFEIAGFELIRHHPPGEGDRTLFRLTPSNKVHRLETPAGPLEICAAPAVPPRPGQVARVPPIVMQTADMPGQDGQRILRTFEAVHSLSAAHVRLPALIAGGRAEGARGEHVSRLDFADAEVRFVLPSLPGVSSAVSSDGLVPLGPGAPSDAWLDLGRATLTVLRPADLLALSFRFSGLLLELPPRSEGRAPRVLPSRGGPVCRSGGIGSNPPVRDLRPVMVVTFPPQHVAERAYFRRLQPLPELALSDAPEFLRLLATLRERKPSRGQDTTELREARIAARAKFKALDPKFTPDAPDARAEFERRASRTTGTAPRLPREQQVYLGPEFMDPDALGLMREILAASPAPHDPIAALTLPDLMMTQVLAPFGLVPPGSIKPGPPFDVFTPDHREAAEAIERAKDQMNSDYAAFRAGFTARFAAFGYKLTYLGATWFGRVGHLCPPAVSDWVARYEATQDQAEAFETVTEARLSGPSRLAFRINCDDFQAEHAGGGFDFSLEALTDWDSMDLSVVRRAERLFKDPPSGPAVPSWARVIDLDDGAILLHQGLSRGDHIARAEDHTRRGGILTPGVPAYLLPPSPIQPRQRLAEIAEASRARPDPFQTAIELPFRLTLSPAQDATWRVPRASVLRKAFGALPVNADRELWSARLAGTGTDAGVRAVWSEDYRPEALLAPEAPGAPPHGPWAPWSLPRGFGTRTPPDGVPRFRTAIDAYDRHELVVLSSVHGLPVLGRRNMSGLLLDGSQFDPPDGFTLAGLERNAPKADDGTTPLRARDYSAIYRPQPLFIEELSLTALGGTLTHDTAFVPPASARLAATMGGRAVNLFDALSIERWRNRTVLGRDISVEVVYKGFLFPIGHKAALVKLTERRFEGAPGNGAPIAVLIQREFLRVGNPEKLFPAYAQPNMARRWPARRVEVLTRRTPDLADHTTMAGGLVPLEGNPGVVFWPRTAPRDGAEVQFEMRIDDEGASGTMPLLFVDNTAAHDADTMKRLAAHYRDHVPNTMRRLPRKGQPVVMAPAAKTGDTTYTTEWWELLAEGRDAAPGANHADAEASFAFDNTDHVIDPFMEGLDQPGFYPLIDTARCRLTQVERMTGKPVVWSDVGYDGRYVAHGFDGLPDRVHNETFLRITGDQVPMTMAGADRAGGIGQPDTLVVGLSREIGPVGASEGLPCQVPCPRPPGTPAVSPAHVPPPTPGTVPSISNHTRTLDPKSLFPAKAKLLGLLELREVLKIARSGLASAQPKLKEVMEYGAAGAAAGASEARAFVTASVLRPMQAAVADLDVQWNVLALGNPAIGDLTPATAYPQIGVALTGLRTGLDASLAGSGLSDTEFFASLATIYEAGRALVGAITEVLRDPLASLSSVQFTALQTLIQQVRTVAALLADPAGALRAGVHVVWEAVQKAVLQDAPWRRLFFILPQPADSSLAAAIDAACQTAINTALDQAFKNGTLDHLGTDAAASLKTQAESAIGALNSALNAAADTVKAEFLSPRLLAIRDAIQTILVEFRALGRDLGTPTPAALATALRRLGTIGGAASTLLDRPITLPGLADACAQLATLPAAVAHLPALLIPLDPATASTGLPKPDAPIRLDEALKPAKALEAALHDLGLQTEQITAALARLDPALQRLRGDAAAAARMAGGPFTTCEVPPQLISTLTAFVTHRNAALDAMQELLHAVAAVPAALPALTSANAALLRPAAIAVRDTLVAGLRFYRAATLIATLVAGTKDEGSTSPRPLDTLQNALNDVAKAVPGLKEVQSVNAALAQLGTGLNKLQTRTRDQAARLRALDPTKLDDTLTKLADEASELTAIVGDVTKLHAGAENQMIQLVLRLGPSVAVAAANRAGEAMLAAVDPLLTELARAYAVIVEKRQVLLKIIGGQATDPNAPPLATAALLQTWLRLVRSRLGDALFTVPCSLPLNTGCTDRLDYEKKLAVYAADTSNSPQDRIAAARALAAVWHEPGPAVVTLAQQFAGINAEFVRTLLLSAIDLRPLRREIESRIRDLIPSRVTLDYDLDNELGPFPVNDPIFVPDPKTRLTLKARTSINLLADDQGHLATTVSVIGQMGPFAIRLLGERFDVVTLAFDGLSFSSGTGRSPDFQVRFRDVTMGEKARFLDQLQAYLSPKGGGFYLRFTKGNAPGIEAGYGINLGVIGIGTLSFSNVVLNAAVRLPFGQGQDARFVISIGRSDAPFLISSTIFGGGGYLALIANAKRFVGFEASFDYGGVAAFGFGPLQGVGRLTMGITMSKEDELTSLGATFFAGGAAHIACFSTCTALMVRLVQDNGGPMCGTATYVYAFSLGVTDVEFQVVVQKDEGRTMGNSTQSGALPSPTRLAATSNGVMSDAVPAIPLPGTLSRRTDAAHVDPTMRSQDEDWSAYRAYFDTALRPARSWRPL